MLNDETLAALAECEHSEVPKALSMLAQRVGLPALAAAVNGLAVPEGGGDDEFAVPRFVRAGDFLRMVGKPPPMLVDGLLPENSLVIFASAPKAGKTYYALDAAESVATGRPVFGRFNVNRPGPVCYAGMEDGKFELANRLIKRGYDIDAQIGQQIPLYICPTRFQVSSPESVGQLTLMLGDIKPVLLVLDTAREALGIQDWNNPAEVSDKLRPLRTFARSVCTVLLIAHNRKGESINAIDSVSGTNAFTSSVDGVISAYRKQDMENGNRRLWLSVDGRGEMRGDYIVDMNTHTLRCTALTDDQIKSEKQMADGEKRAEKFAPLVKAIQEAGGKASIGQIAKNLGAEYHTARAQLMEAIKAGVIAESGEYLPTEKGRPAPLYMAKDLLNSFNSPIGKNKQLSKSDDQEDLF